MVSLKVELKCIGLKERVATQVRQEGIYVLQLLEALKWLELDRLCDQLLPQDEPTEGVSS